MESMWRRITNVPEQIYPSLAKVCFSSPMTLFHSPSGPEPLVPDDLTTTKFIFGNHSLRPLRPEGTPWLVDDETNKGYGLPEIKSKTMALASSLHKRFALKSGDVVVLFSGNHIDYPICIWAVHHILGVIAATNPSFTVPELVHHFKSVKPSIIISHSQVLSTAKAAARDVGLPADRILTIDDFGGMLSVPHLYKEGRNQILREPKLEPGEGKQLIAFLNTSSGTTGTPKIVKISHFALIANTLQVAAHNKINTKGCDQRYRAGGSCLAVLPMYHIYGILLILHFNLYAGLSVVIVPKFNLKSMLDSIVRHRITNLMVVPPQVVLLCKDPIVKQYDLSSVRVVVCGASVLSRELYDQLLELLPQAHVGQVYGATEVTGVASMCPLTDKQNPYGGVFVPGVSGKVVKPDGTLSGIDEEGELYFKSIANTSGYLNDDVATSQAFLSDGWIRSGDIVTIDEAGNINIVDRAKVRGFQVAPAELEGTILDSPLADDACVVSIPDNYSGELPLAFVVPSQRAKVMLHKGKEAEVKSAIAKHVADNKAPFKHISRVEFVDVIPKTPSGKLLRRELREKARLMVKSQTKL